MLMELLSLELFRYYLGKIFVKLSMVHLNQVNCTTNKAFNQVEVEKYSTMETKVRFPMQLKAYIQYMAN